MVFVGRQRELGILEGIRSREGVKTCLIYGRRRVGKSELIRQFCRGRRSLIFEFTVGSLSSQLEYMADVVSSATGAPAGPYGSLYACLKDVASFCRESETVVVFDEFQYLVAGDDGDAVSSEVQRFVDTLLDGTGAMVVLCGSHTSMMLQLTSDPGRPLYGRFADAIRLRQLSPGECLGLHPGMSELDVLKLYLSIGGVPGFHKAAVGDTFEECVWSLFLRDQAVLGNEVQLLLGTGAPQSDKLRRVIRAVSEGAVTNRKISDKAGVEQRHCSQLLRRLVEMEVLGVHHPMHGAPKHPVYYIADDAVAFYYGVYEANRARIDPDRFGETMDAVAHAISAHLGMRFEKVCAEFLRKSYYCTEVGRWWGPDRETDENGRPAIVDIDVTARAVRDGVSFDIFGECKMRNRLTGFTELNELMRRVGLTKSGANPRYMLFSTSGFDADLTDYADERSDVMLVDLDMIMGRRAAPPL